MTKEEEIEQPLPALTHLRVRPQWVCWRKEQRGGKTTKIPYDPRTGRRAASNHPATWASYDMAQQAYEWSQKGERRPYDGIGYVFHRDITGIDLDHCIAPDSSIDGWARAYLDRLHSYSERSPSEEGIHILVSGTVPKGIRRGVAGQRHAEAAIEMYCEGRYFTVTGSHLESTPTTIEACQNALDALYAELRTPEIDARPLGNTQGPESGPTVSQDDELLLKKAMAASNGDKFHALFYDGSPAGYPSASEADMALCMMLAFWTGRDTARMDRLFRRSALYREKWDTGRSESTYGWETIHKAAAKCCVIYHPNRTLRQLELDIERLLQQIAQQIAKLGTNKKRKPHQLTPKEVPTAKVLAYLDENEYGDARFFADVFAGQVCYDHTEKKWYLWDGHSWKWDTTGKVRQLVAGVLGSLYLRAAADLNTTHAEIGLKIQALQGQGIKEGSSQLKPLTEQYKQLSAQMSELQNRAKALRGAKRNANVLRFVESEMGITSEMWDTNPWLLAVSNGVLDLHTGVCREGEPADYIRTVSPTEWTGLDTPCPRFERFLQEIFEEKADRDILIAFLQRLLGYGITGLTEQHIFPILYGAEGRNGKDTLLKTLKAVLGALVGAVSNDVFLAQDKLRSGGAATPHLCDLQGKRLAWGSETKEGDRLNIAQIKLLTGGGDISARQLQGHQYTFAPTHKLLLMTNYKPHAEARDKAFWSRAILIEFGIRYVEDPKAPNERLPDLTLGETLKGERSGILAWLVRGCLVWQKQGLDIPASVKMATDKYREEEDKLLQFIQECCIQVSHASVGAEALFKAYKNWYEANQFGGKAMNGKLFGEEMGKRFKKEPTRNGRVYQGIGLLTHDPDEGTLFSNQMKREGSVKGSASPFTHDESASEANRQDTDGGNCEGCEGLRHVFAKNEKIIPPIEGKHGNTLHTLHTTPSTVTSNSASEADTVPVKGQNAPFTDPSHETDGHACTTRYEKRKEAAHEAAATHFVAGYWWCEKCEPQRAFVALGEETNYPHIHAHGFKVPSGRENWLRFAQEAGYTMVQSALEAAQSRDVQEL